ncbi:sodium- and chloride-dependent glycinetransporter 1 [Striga asiatica]|uniref:Sodium-and chloride-dependent glycinetransporter 1 n=1 Tax=Striga asiatica TaxID=4170 RepID=A0A5A7R5J8_STRAF|nr:sodium- and chloride-dependent glycinetransporter 1 [Striga asiatica]
MSGSFVLKSDPNVFVLMDLKSGNLEFLFLFGLSGWIYSYCLGIECKARGGFRYVYQQWSIGIGVHMRVDSGKEMGYKLICVHTATIPTYFMKLNNNYCIVVSTSISYCAHPHLLFIDAGIVLPGIYGLMNPVLGIDVIYEPGLGVDYL